MFLRAALGQVIGELENAVDANAGHDGLLQHDFPLGAREHLAADAGIFAFGVFPHDPEVDVTGLAIGQRGLDARHQAARAQVDVLVEFATELQQRIPQGNVIRHDVWPAHRTEVDRVVVLEKVEPVVGHHFAVGQVVIGAGEIKPVPLQLQIVFGRHGVEYAHAFGHDFLADAVAGDHCNLVLGFAHGFDSWD
ncbi:hypothetical protein D9M71_630560 [compost metagenome]